MTVYKRGSVWWANFTVNGKRIQTSTGCTEKKKATDWEKAKIASLAGEEDATIALEKVKRALVDQNLPLRDAWGRFEMYPRATSPSAKLLAQYKAVFDDFCAFLDSERITVAEVSDHHAREYINKIRQHGRCSGFSYRRGGKSIAVSKTATTIAPRTVNFYIGFLRLFFSIMQKLKLTLENPFEAVEKMVGKSVCREIFSDDEIALLLTQKHHRLYPLIVFGLYTGLRRGDIVRLKHSDIDWQHRFIRIDQNKTAAAVDIPMLPPVAVLVAGIKRTGGALFPELLADYDDQDDRLSAEFKALLDSVGISGATVTVPGRARKQSVKDVHSLRHTFAYLAGKHGIPFAVVQSILGHMTPAMTRHYMAHANDADKVNAMAAFPDLSKRSATKLPVALRVGRLIDRITPGNLEAAKRRIGKILGGVQ